MNEKFKVVVLNTFTVCLHNDKFRFLNVEVGLKELSNTFIGIGNSFLLFSLRKGFESLTNLV